MINRKIVFITGAGSSIPYEMPSGIELLEDACKHLTFSNDIINKFKDPQCFEHSVISQDNSLGKDLKLLLHDNKFKPEEMINFKIDLAESNCNSIDAFLEHRPEYISIGKLIISYLLIKYEDKSKSKLKGDWLRYLWNQIISETNFDNFELNNISFITFNYDRLIEYFLITSMHALYGKSINECEKKLNNISIVHLHGKLGELTIEDNYSKVKLGEEIKDYNKLKQIAENIKIITDKIDNDPEFKIATDLILAADEVYILGLGYNQTNLNRLNLSKFGKPIRGTGLDLTQNEINTIKQRNISEKFVQYRLEIEQDYNCLDFLREKVNWI